MATVTGPPSREVYRLLIRDLHLVSKARNLQCPRGVSAPVIGGIRLLERPRHARITSGGLWTHVWLRSLAAYLLLPNILFAILGQFVYVTRPLINIDYLLLGCIAGLLPWRVVTAAYALLVANDAFVSLSPVFHFGLETAVFSFTFALTRRLAFSSVAVLFAASATAVAIVGERLSGARETRVARPGLLAAAVLIIGIDILGGTSALSHADSATLRVNIATSAMWKTGTTVRRGMAAVADGQESGNVPSMMSATDGIRQALTSGVGGSSVGAVDVVLVIVESMGHFKAAGVDSQVLAPLLSDVVASRYRIRVGTVAARGATTNGELRELCEAEADYRKVRRVESGDCLPAMLRRDGFRTIALHGYSQEFFDRYQWYPRLGFEQMRFGEQLTRLPGIPLCGSTFRGVCDAAVGQILKQQLERAPKGEHRFIYWLTLSSHLPLDATGAEGSTLDCRQSAEGRQSEDVCILMRIHRLVATEVATIAMDPALPRTRFVLVGDHSPPFFSREKRALFVPNEVPFVELIPRPLNLQPGATRPTTAAAGIGGR